MEQNDAKTMTSPCGINCADCAAHRADKDPALMERLMAMGFKKESLPCPGCRPLKGHCPLMPERCETYSCIEKRGHAFCFECADFPCVNLHPVASGADRMVQNLKMYNLCTIKNRGLEAWYKQTADIKKRYFKGKLVIGKGPKLEGE